MKLSDGLLTLFLVTLVAFGAVLLPPVSRPCWAQDASPIIVSVFPAGGQQGTTVEATVIGEGLTGATEVYVSGDGVTATITDEETTKPVKRPPRRGSGAPQKPKPWNNAQVATSLIRLSINIAPDAALGPRDLRLVTPAGLTPRWRFFVDQLPEVVITEPNLDPDTATLLESLPVVINGQIYSGWVGTIATEGTPDRGFFRLTAKPGQTLVCELQARKLIPFIDQAVPGFFDACVTLRDTTGRRLKYADDFRFSPDPVLSFTVEEEDEYLLEVRDIIYRSSHDFIYRMRLGALPFLTHVFPLGGRRGTDVELELYGVNLPNNRLTMKIPADSPDTNWVSVSGGECVSNALPLAVDDLPEMMEAESNDAADHAQPVTVPAVINGRIEKPGDADYFSFQAEAGQRLAVQVQARRFGSPLDSILTLYDADGQQLDQYDDPAPQAVPNALGTGVENDMGASVHPRDALLTHRADARIVRTFASSGHYVVKIADVTEQGSPEYAYRLRIAPAEMDFTVRVKTAAASMGQGDTALIAVNALRTDGFDGPISVNVQDLPPGFVASSALIPTGETDGHLTITASADAAPGIHSARFVGEAEIDGQTRVHDGIPVETVGQAFYIKHMVPTEEFLLHVGEKAAFTLSADVPSDKGLEIPPGSDFKLVIKASRLANAKGVIAISAVSLPTGVTVKAAQIPANKNEVEVTVTATPQASADTVGSLILTGTMTVGKQSIIRAAPAIPVRVVAN